MHGSISAIISASGVHLPPVSLPKPVRSDGAGSSHPPVPFVMGSSKECDYEVPAPGWEPRHVAFAWSRKYATWQVENLSTTPLYVGNHCLLHGERRPLLLEEAFLTSEGVALHFLRNPSVPRCGQAADGSFPLLAAGLTIGRGPPKSDAQEIPHLELDPDIQSISSHQAEIRKVGRDFVLFNCNTDGRGRTIVNGDQNFDERKLILGDCIQIPSCDYYTFKFTGEALRHLGEGGRLQGFGLTVDVETKRSWFGLVRGRPLRILHPVTLELRRGEFLGIIGGSGQGKSTLMNALCGIVPATVGGVSVDGLALRSPREVARAGIGYVPQDDIVHRELTVEQALRYAARLRLKATQIQTQDLLEATMETLHLTEHREKRISDLSGGQRKRVSIASELLVSPDYIFLDEPTSGLDPWMEQELMGELSALAQSRRIGVACTTHVLQNCHVLSHLAFISRGRLISYGKPAEVVRFFFKARSPEGAKKTRERSSASTSSGGRGVNDSPRPAIPSGEGEFDEADLLGKIANIYPIAQDMRKSPEEQDRVAEAWEKEYQALAEIRLLAPPTPCAATAPPRAPARVGVVRCLFLLISRQWKILVSSKLNYLFLAAQAVLIGLLISWVDANVVLQMFLSLIATLWFGCSNGATQIVGELPIFRRERLAGLGINTYLLSKFVFLTAITALQALILFAMVICGSHLFHSDTAPDPAEQPPDRSGHVPDKATIAFHEGFFDKVWSALASGDDSHESDSASDDAAPVTAGTSDADFRRCRAGCRCQQQASAGRATHGPTQALHQPDWPSHWRCAIPRHGAARLVFPGETKHPRQPGGASRHPATGGIGRPGRDDERQHFLEFLHDHAHRFAFDRLPGRGAGRCGPGPGGLGAGRYHHSSRDVGAAHFDSTNPFRIIRGHRAGNGPWGARFQHGLAEFQSATRDGCRSHPWPRRTADDESNQNPGLSGQPSQRKRKSGI